SFFEIPLLGKNRPGTDSIYRLSLLVPDESALKFFKERLNQFNIAWTSFDYLNQPAITFKDIDGLEIILLVNDNYHTPNAWRNNPYTEIPEQYQILGMGPVELRVKNAQATLDFLKNCLSYTLRSDVNETVMTLDQNGLYNEFDI